MSLMETHFRGGARENLGSHVFTAGGIVAFARKFDPQRFHVDAEQARASIFGGLCASGWHTTAVWMKKNLEHIGAMKRRWQTDGVEPLVFGPSPGVRNLRWLKPVYAGEEIVFFSTAVSERQLASRPGWHLLENIGEAETPDGKPVMRFESAVMFRLQAPEEQEG